MSKIINRNGWWYYYRSHRGRVIKRSLRTRNKRDAQRLKRVLDRRALDDLFGVKSSSVGLEQFLERYLQYSQTNKAPRTFEEERRILHAFWMYVGNIDLGAVTPECVEGWKGHRKERVSPVTVNMELRHLQAAFSVAEQWELIERNPFKRVKKLSVDQKQPRFLRAEEIRAVLSHIGDRTRPFILLGLYTGLRLGEIVNLQWSDIDWDRGVIHVASRKTHHTKSRKERSIPLHPELRAILKSIPRTGLALWPYTDGTLSRHFKQAVRGAGLSDDITFHTLRHTFASYLVELGQPIRQVQELLGHSTVTVTEIYAHLQDESLQRAVSVLRFSSGEK